MLYRETRYWYFMDEWKALYESKSGERGIFNRESANKQANKNGRRTVEGHEFGTNPCLRLFCADREFCNLSEVVVRASDTPKSLLKDSCNNPRHVSHPCELQVCIIPMEKNCEERDS